VESYLLFPLSKKQPQDVLNNAPKMPLPNRTSGRVTRITLALFSASIGLVPPCTMIAQQDTLSPVFKSSRLPRELPIIEQSDATYQIWRAFQTSRKASAGDVLAQHELGLRYLLGKGFAPDTVKGAYWIAQAASKGLIPARFNLGILQYNGWGMSWNPFDAYKSFQYCAAHGMAEGEFLLGVLETENLVVPRNLDSSLYWISAAADSGFEPARLALPEIQRVVATRGTQRPDSASRHTEQDTLSLQPIAIDFGPDTTSNLHERYLLADALRSVDPEVRKRMGLPEQLDKDASLDSTTYDDLEQSAEEGSPEALIIIGRCRERGIIVKADPVAAALYYIRALRLDSPKAPGALTKLVTGQSFSVTLKSRADHDDPAAQTVWAALHALGFDGLLYEKKMYITDAQALGLLEKASHHQFAQANIELGLAYYGGKWVPVDLDKAIEYWTMASQQGSKEGVLRIAVTTIRRAKDEQELQDAISVLRNAVAKGAVLAEVALGYCYETGTGVAKNVPEAVKLYRNGLHRGSQDAYRALRRLHDEVRPSDRIFQMDDD
jgi:uncharacterized protein